MPADARVHPLKPNADQERGGEQEQELNGHDPWNPEVGEMHGEPSQIGMCQSHFTPDEGGLSNRGQSPNSPPNGLE